MEYENFPHIDLLVIDVLYSILANPEHQKDIKNILMASGIPKEKIDTAIEKTFAHPVRGDSFRGLVKESRDRILQSLYSICFCEDSFNENLWLKYADNHHSVEYLDFHIVQIHIQELHS